MKDMAIRLAWLAGIIDGEGWFRVRVQPRRSGHGNAGFQIGVKNTSMPMLAEIMAIYDAIGIHYTFYASQKNPRWRPSWTVEVGRRRDTRVLAEAIRPYLVSKAGHAEILIRAVTHRLSLGHHCSAARSESYASPQTDPVFAEMIAQLQHLNHPQEGDFYG